MSSYWVLDSNGAVVAVVSPTDPDMKRVLSKAQSPLARKSPPVAPKRSAPAPAARAPWAPAPKQAAVQHESAVFRIRHVPTGKFLGASLDPTTLTPAKTWVSAKNARTAITHAVRKNRGTYADYEIVEFELNATK